MSRDIKKRFVGPFLLSLLLCFLLIDYLSYSRAGHSPLARFWRLLGILAMGAYDALNSLALLLNTFFLLLGGISVTAILFVWVSLRRAKKAMERAKESAAGPAFEQGQLLSSDPPPETAPVRAPVSSTASSSAIGLSGKTIGGFAFTAVMFCFVSLLIVYMGLSPAIEKEINERSSLLATEIGEVAASYIAEKNLSALRKEVAKYASRGDVAYIAIKNSRGRLVVQSPADSEIVEHASFSRKFSRGLTPTTIRYGEKYLTETLVELDKGRKGVLYIGIWSDVPEQVLRNIFRPLGWSMVAMLIATITACALFFRRIRRRLQHLAQSAEQISAGNFEIAVSVGRKDEIDELACSLERMRSSLKAVMTRLARN